MLPDRPDGWSIPRKGRVDRVCYSSNPDNSLRSVLKSWGKCENTQRHVLVTSFYFREILILASPF